MESNYLLRGIIFLSLSILGFIYHKWWIKNKLKKETKLGTYDKTFRKLTDWGFIIICGLLSILSFIDYIF